MAKREKYENKWEWRKMGKAAKQQRDMLGSSEEDIAAKASAHVADTEKKVKKALGIAEWVLKEAEIASRHTAAFMEKGKKEMHGGGRKKTSFEDWMRQVDNIVSRNTGVSVHDLPDMNYRDLYDAGTPPSRVASKAKRNAMESVEVDESFLNSVVTAVTGKPQEQRKWEKAMRSPDKAVRVAFLKKHSDEVNKKIASIPYYRNTGLTTKTNEELERQSTNVVAGYGHSKRH